MITQQVICDIYKSYNKPCKSEKELNLPYFVELLSPFHKLTLQDDTVIVEGLEEPFKRFLKRGLYAVLEFDHNVAFVFRAHILFFSKTDNTISVHLRPANKRSFLSRIFGKNN